MTSIALPPQVEPGALQDRRAVESGSLGSVNEVGVSLPRLDRQLRPQLAEPRRPDAHEVCYVTGLRPRRHDHPGTMDGPNLAVGQVDVDLKVKL